MRHHKYRIHSRSFTTNLESYFMQASNSLKQPAKRGGLVKHAIKSREQEITASSPWSVVHRIRLPHKPGLPLSSGGGGDGGG